MVTEREILDLAKRIERQFSPERVVLFGSYAYGTPGPHSDVDLLVVMPFEGKPSRLAMDMWRQTRPAFPVDLVIRRPDDLARQYAEWDPLVREALDNGKTLYERDGAPVDAEGGGRLPRRPTRAFG